MSIEKKEVEQATAIVAKSVPIGIRGVELRTLDELWRFAAMAYKCGMVPASIKSAEQATLVLQFGLELGLTPMASLQNMYVVNNRPALYGEIGIALVEATGLMEHFKQYFTGAYGDDNYTAVCEVKRKGDVEVMVKEFSVADAKRAKLWATNTWTNYPKDMLMWKATWRALKSRFADVLKGVMPADFAEEYVDALKVEEVAQTRQDGKESLSTGKSKADRIADTLDAMAASAQAAAVVGVSVPEVSEKPELTLTPDGK